MADKISKAEADYRKASGNKRCGNCNMFLKPDKGDLHGACTLVKGSIYAADTCKFWEAK